MNFKITFSTEIGGFEDFATNPEKYFQDRNIAYYPDINLEDSVKTYKKMLKEPTFLL